MTPAPKTSRWRDVRPPGVFAHSNGSTTRLEKCNQSVTMNGDSGINLAMERIRDQSSSMRNTLGSWYLARYPSSAFVVASNPPTPMWSPRRLLRAIQANDLIAISAWPRPARPNSLPPPPSRSSSPRRSSPTRTWLTHGNGNGKDDAGTPSDRPAIPCHRVADPPLADFGMSLAGNYACLVGESVRVRLIPAKA